MATGEALRSAPVKPRRGAAKPDLFADPMPARIEPCLALLQSKAPTGPNWAFEVKWDGYRLAVHRDASGVRIITRGGHDWTHRFPSIAAEAAELDAGSFILDGEAVVLDEAGRADFGLLQQALGGRGGKAKAERAMLFAFDLLYLDGHDLTRMALSERRDMLEGLLDGEIGMIRLSEEVEADGAEFLASACKVGLEGIIAKRRDAPYRPGRGGDWLKIKCIQSDTFLIIGYEPSSAALGGIGRLLLAGLGNYGLAFVGSVGTGFTHASAAALRKQLDRLATASPAARGIAGRGVVWVRPNLAAEIAYRGWTHDDKLRHASFKGLRDKADAAGVYRLA
ncbi:MULTISPECIES: non-homologous end-joining DNA ligase [unclassified Bosea (in: a-proteobacteria)]